MMSPVSIGLFLCALLLQAARGECPGERPTKNLLCYVEEISQEFDPCLCTHLVLHTHLEKLSPQSELVVSARRLQERNPSLRLLLQVSESADVALKRRGGYAQTVAQAVAKNSLDGVEVALTWGRQVAGKVQLVDFIQSLSKELDKLEPKERSKRSYEIYESIPSDTVTPRWTLPVHGKKHMRKTREAEDEEETTTAKKEEENESNETTTTEESKQEIVEEEEPEDQRRQIILHLTAEPQILAKNFDLKRLSKYVSLYTLASDNLTDTSEHGLAFHPSRLMGIEDILNADSLIDLVTGLGAPRQRLVLTLPATVLRFTLQDKDKNIPQSRVTSEPSKITRAEMCKLMSQGEWTVERDEDLTAPYAYHDTTWLAFDDPTSVSIKGKYVLLRDLAGAAVRGADAEDWLGKCADSAGPTLLKTLHDTFTHISRQSRAAQLVSLQEQLHEAGHTSYSGDVHLSPYRIVRVVDREGSIHVVRKEAKTEFECSRQGYFRHPSGCNRFYRCVKFNQYSPDFTVFEYDCPAGLAFDETVEVCVWPGSLADGGACQGSSEIAPVPRSRYACPEVAGYYADPENCRWFFACLDHSGDGTALTAYEFRCPFGLVFDEQALVCNWPWLVPGCGGAGVYRARFTVGDFYEGRHRPSYASLSDVHVSGGRIENVPGGVVLGSAVSGLGSGAYLGSYASGSNALGAGLYPGAYVAGSAGYAAGGLASGSYQSNGLGGYSSGSGDAYRSGASGGAYSSGVGSGYAAGGAGSAGSAGYAAGGLASGSYQSKGLGGYSSGSGDAYRSGASGGAYSSGVGSRYAAGGTGSAGSAGYSSGAQGTGDLYTFGAKSQGAGAYSSGAGAAYSGANSGYSGSSGIQGAYGAGGSGSQGGYGSGGSGSAGTVYSSGVGSGAYNAGLKSSGALYSSGLSTGSGSGAYSSGVAGSSGKFSGSGVAYGTYGAGSYAGGDYSGAYIDNNSGAYVEDNSGAYIHDSTGDFGGLYTHQGSYGGQYAGGYSAGGAYVHGQYDNGAYKGSSSSGGQYKGSQVGGGAYSGSYDSGAYRADISSGGQYKGGYDTGSYSGKYDTGAYSGKYDTDGYSGKYDAGSYSGKYDGGAYSGKYDGGAYSGASDSGSYQGGSYHSGSASYQGGYKVKTVPTAVVTDGGYGSHEYNSVNIVEHKPAIGLVGLDAVKVSGGDYQSGGYVSSYVTSSPLPAVSVTTAAPVVSRYSTVTPAPISVSTYTASTVQPTTPRPLTYYPVSSSPVTPVQSRPLVAYSTVRPPLSVQTYQQPSYVKTVTPTVSSYSYATPTIGVVKTPVVPLSPVTYSYKQPAVVNTEYVASGVNYRPQGYVSGASYQQQSYVKSVTPAPYYEKDSLVYSGPEYLPPLPSYRYDYKPATFIQPADIKYSYPKPAVLKTPIVPLNPIQYSTPAPLPVAPLRPVSYATPAPVPVFKYTPAVLKTPVVPLNPVQYSTPAPVTYVSTPSPVKTVSYSTYSTPSPPVSYQVPVQPVSYSTPAPPVSYEYSVKPLKPVSYPTPAPVSVQYNVPTVLKTPVVPLNPVLYTTPAPIHVEYQTPAPIRPVSYAKPTTYSTPAPAVSYEYLPPAPVQPVSYAKPLRPVIYTTPAPAINYQYSAPAKPVLPVVAKTPVVPLNPIQYTTPAPPVVDNSYLPPAPVSYVRPAAPAVTYKFATPAPAPAVYSTPAPAVVHVDNSYLPPPSPVQPVSYVKPVTYKFNPQPAAPVVLKTPVVPLNPIQYTTPAPVHFEYSTPAPLPVKPLRPITYTTPAPPVIQEYLPPAPVQPVRPLRPIAYSTPAPPVNREYLPPAPAQPLRPITYSTPAPLPAVSYEYSTPAVRPVVPTVLKTPVVPLNPVQYSTPAPSVTYRPITLSSPAPFSYEYQPVKQVPTVLKTPVVPLNPVQYTTPAPTVLQYSTPAPVSYVKPLRPVTYTTAAPAVSYEYSTSAAPPVSYVKSIPTVFKTPVVPLNPVQYSTPAPVVHHYSLGVAYQKPETQYQSGVYYQRPAVVNKQFIQEQYNYEYQKPAVKFVNTPQVVSTTPAPSVTYSYETPEPVTPLYKQVYNYVKAPMVTAYEKVLNAISYSTTPAPLPVQTVTQSPVTYAPVNVDYSYRKPALVKTASIPVTPVAVVPEYNKVLNVVKATTTPAPLYVNHYTSSYEEEVVPVSTPKPVVYKQKPIVVPDTYVKDYSYEENIEDAYDAVKSDFGVRLNGGYEEGYAYNQQRIVVPEVKVYTSTTPAPVTYRVRKPVKTYVQTYEQPAVAVGYEAGSYNGESVYSTTAAPAVVVSSSEGSYGEQYHKETAYSGFNGNGGVSTPCDHGVTHVTTEGPAVRITTARVSLPVVTPRPQGGYYVRKQKVRVRPVVTTENYPDLYSSTYTPSTVFTTTTAPRVTVSTTVHPDDVVDVEGEDEEEVKLLEGYNRQFGGIVGQEGYTASSTVSSIEDGEAVVGVLKKGRITQDGRRTRTKVVVVSKLSDFNPLLVGKLGAECSCDGRSNALTVNRRTKQRLFTPSRDSTIPDQLSSDSYSTSTTTSAPSYDAPVVEIRPTRKRTRYQSSTTSTAAPSYEDDPEEPNYVSAGDDRVKVESGRVECKRAGLFRHPNKCNKFYSCDWDQWKKKFTLHEFKCPIHLAYDTNLGACNWPSKGPACAEDNLLV